MIDWTATKEKYGYSKSSDLIGIKRPKVVCRCDKCEKRRDITIRVKSKIVNEQMCWICPSCVGFSRSDSISEQMRNKWNNYHYKAHQLLVKNTDNYVKVAREASIKRWKNEEYRSKLEVGIRKDEFIEKCINKFNGQFSYDHASFRDWRHTITISCLKCNTTFKRKPLQHLNVGYCPVCNTSYGQRQIAEFIKSLGFKPSMNDRQILDGREIDIIVGNVGIEYHGLYWHSYNRPETKNEIFRHQNKANDSTRAGIRLFQFFDFEWTEQTDIIKSMLANALGLSTSIYARKLKHITLTNDEISPFFRENHLQGHRPASVNLGLTDGNILFAAASFSKRGDGHELIRLASKRGYCVVGGASKLLKRFSNDIGTTLYTFADLRYSNGDVYKQLGFKQISITRPGYLYYRKKDGGYQILSRQQCQKHKLSKLLGDGFDPSLSESQNMFNNNYRRVWTAGNLSFILQ